MWMRQNDRAQRDATPVTEIRSGTGAPPGPIAKIEQRDVVGLRDTDNQDVLSEESYRTLTTVGSMLRRNVFEPALKRSVAALGPETAPRAPYAGPNLYKKVWTGVDAEGT